MTVLAGAEGPDGAAIRDVRRGWRPSASGGSLECGHAHPFAAGGSGGGGRGQLDESARRLSHDEYAVARLLSSEGHVVRSVAESRRHGRTPDLTVCGTPVEVKSFAPLGDRRRPPSPQSVVNKLLSARGQAPHVVLVAGASGLSADVTRLGLARYAGLAGTGDGLSSVRVVGDGYDLSWTLAAVPVLRRGPDMPGHGPTTGRRPRSGREPGL